VTREGRSNSEPSFEHFTGLFVSPVEQGYGFRHNRSLDESRVYRFTLGLFLKDLPNGDGEGVNSSSGFELPVGHIH
jgi:hypothetical protein